MGEKSHSNCRAVNGITLYIFYDKEEHVQENRLKSLLVLTSILLYLARYISTNLDCLFKLSLTITFNSRGWIDISSLSVTD